MKFSPVYSLPLVIHAAHSRRFIPEFPGSAVSWGAGRVDVFVNDYGTIQHKYHANPQAGWNDGFEDMGFPKIDLANRPSTVSWSENRLDLFATSLGTLYHKYWDGSTWLPSDEAESLGAYISGPLAVTSWSVGRFDIVGRGLDYNYVHKYYDGSSWQPKGTKVESLGSDGFDDEYFDSEPAAVSWGENRLDIFGILTNGTLLHKYWDGTAWQPSGSGWEQWGDNFTGTPIATSWGENRLDVWALSTTEGHEGELVHRYWDGKSLSDIETLGGSFSTTPAVNHWDVNRIDIFGNVNGLVYYKYWDGHQWNPSDISESWSLHSPNASDVLLSGPASVSWSSNNLHAFVFNTNGTLKWQFWEGSQWLPKVNDFYNLGTLPSFKSKKAHALTMKEARPSEALVVQDEERNFDL